MKKLAVALCSTFCLLAPNVQAEQGLNIRLVQMRQEGSCKLYWEAENQTGLNITHLSLNVAYKDSGGMTLYDNTLILERIQPGKTVENSLYASSKCAEIKTVKFTKVSTLKTDDKFRQLDSAFMNKFDAATSYSSKVSGVKVIN